jgi:hypothetical protein
MILPNGKRGQGSAHSGDKYNRVNSLYMNFRPMTSCLILLLLMLVSGRVTDLCLKLRGIELGRGSNIFCPDLLRALPLLCCLVLAVWCN